MFNVPVTTCHNVRTHTSPLHADMNARHGDSPAAQTYPADKTLHQITNSSKNNFYCSTEFKDYL